MRLVLTTLFVAGSLGAWALTSPPAVAATAARDAATQTTRTPNQAKAKRRRVKIDKSSHVETRSERERRLKRECRGMPNAGACLGYTR